MSAFSPSLFCLGVALAQSVGAPCHAQSSTTPPELGRLFFSPAERLALERPATLSATPGTIRLNGYVRRSGGPETVWINGQPGDLGQTIAGTVRPLGFRGDRVLLIPQAGKPAVAVKPGDAVEPETGVGQPLLPATPAGIKIHEKR